MEGEINHSTMNQGGDAFDARGGIGFAGLLGYRWDNGFDVGAGYSVVPADVSGAYVARGVNFGGVELRFCDTF